MTAQRAQDILTVLRIREEFDIPIVLDGAAEAYELLDRNSRCTSSSDRSPNDDAVSGRDRKPSASRPLPCFMRRTS